MEELSCLLDTPGLEVYHDELRGWLYTQWLGMHDEASIQQAIKAICECLRGRSYTKILSDHSGLVGKWPGEAPWVVRAYFDYLAAQGITYFAWVYNESYYNRTAMEQALHGLKSPVVDIFKDVASAYEWLRRCPVLPLRSPF